MRSGGVARASTNTAGSSVWPTAKSPAGENEELDSAQHRDADTPSRRGGVFRGFLLILFALLAAMAVVTGATWWQEGALREAESALEQKDPKRAIALVSYFLETHEGHDRALAVKARALCELGEADQALEIYDRVGAATTEDVRSWARAYMLRSQWSRALPLIQLVVTREPAQADPLYELTTCRLRLGLLDEALESARQLAALPGQEARGEVILAVIYNDLGNLEESIASYARATEISPDGSAFPMPADEVFFQYGDVLLKAGKPEEAERILEKCLANRPSAAAYLALGDAHLQSGRADQARHAWEMSLRLDNRNAPAREALANAALLQGDAETGLELLAPVVEANQARHSTAYLLQRLHAFLKHHEEADRWRARAAELRAAESHANTIEEMLVRSPHTFWAKVVRAHRFASQGEWEQAADSIAGLDEQAPQEPFVAELKAAIENKGELPSLDRLPVGNN
jgi:tetratricopeptide (TPR) repeat protein